MKNKKLIPEEKKITELLERLNNALNTSLQENELWKQRLNFLFSQIDRVKNIRALMDNPELIQAYLLLQGNRYKEKFDTISLLEKVSKEVELVEKELEKKELTNGDEIDNEKLLVMLGERLRTKEIQGLYLTGSSLNLRNEQDEVIFRLYLETGKTEPNRVDKFFEEHELNKKNDDKGELKK